MLMRRRDFVTTLGEREKISFERPISAASAESQLKLLTASAQNSHPRPIIYLMLKEACEDRPSETGCGTCGLQAPETSRDACLTASMMWTPWRLR